MTRGRPFIGKVRKTRMDDDLWDRLKAEAKRQGIPLAELIRRACEKEVGK